MQWYYIDNGEQAGPVEDEALRQLIAEGKVSDQTPVWRPGMADWITYGEARSAAGQGQAAVTMASVTELGSQDAPCAECGRVFPVAEMVAYSGQHVCADCKPFFFQKIKEGVSVDGALVYGGFWIRAGAYIIDQIILYIASIPFNLALGALGALGGSAEDPRAAVPVVGLSLLVGLIVPTVYYTFMHGRFGQTVGKMALGLRVVTPEGGPISYARAFGRYFATFLSGLILGIGYIMAGFDEEKRTLHDRICNTRVIRTR